MMLKKQKKKKKKNPIPLFYQGGQMVYNTKIPGSNFAAHISFSRDNTLANSVQQWFKALYRKWNQGPIILDEITPPTEIPRLPLMLCIHLEPSAVFVHHRMLSRGIDRLLRILCSVHHGVCYQESWTRDGVKRSGVISRTLCYQWRLKP